MPHSTLELSAITELIGDLWLNEISFETLRTLAGRGMRETYQQLGGFIPEKIDETMIDQLATEYCALLIGPKNHLSPVQSVWTTNQFQSQSAASMDRFFGLIPGYQPKSNLADHIGVQLDFLSHLMRQTDVSAANDIASLFVPKHLDWTHRFLDKVEHQPNSKFYHGLARVTRSLIETLRQSQR